VFVMPKEGKNQGDKGGEFKSPSSKGRNFCTRRRGRMGPVGFYSANFINIGVSGEDSRLRGTTKRVKKLSSASLLEGKILRMSF